MQNVKAHPLPSPSIHRTRIFLLNALASSLANSVHYIEPKKLLLSSWKCDTGCSSLISDPDSFQPGSGSRNQGIKKALDPGSGSATLPILSVCAIIWIALATIWACPPSAGEFCEENVCRPGCHSDSNCPFGQICGDGDCRDGCNFNNDCPINQVTLCTVSLSSANRISCALIAVLLL